MANIQDISALIGDYVKDKKNFKGSFTVSESEQHEITMKDGKFTLFRTLFDNNMNIKVIVDQKQGSASTNKCSKEAVFAAIDDAINSAESGNPDECFDIAPGLEPEKFTMGVLEPDINRLMERTKELSEDIAEKYKKVKIIEMFSKYVKGRSIYTNTNGTRDEKEFGYYELALEFAGNDGESTGGVLFTGVAFDNLDEKLINLGFIDKELEIAENSLNPIKINDKVEGDVILTPESTAQMLGALIANTVGDDVILDKRSKWLDKMDQQVASSILTVSSRPWDKRIVNHEVHTADGFRSKDYTIIENGVLKGLATSLYTSKKCNVKRAENTGGNIIVEAGDIPYKDMIKSVKKGIIVGYVSGGAPNSSGEMSGVAKNSFYIEDGEIKGAVTETMISGNLMEMAMNIKEISKELTCDGYSVLPYIKV